MRAFFFFLCGIAIVVLRISQFHPGLRTSDSAFLTFFGYALKFQTIETVFTYAASAYFFSQLYLWTQPEDSGLEWITKFMTDRARLNEKPLFLTTHLVLLGVYQALQHLFYDVDQMFLGTARPQNAGQAEDGDSATQFRRFRDALPLMAIDTINQSTAGLVISAVIYPIFLRGTLWKINMMFMRPFYNLPRTNMVPSTLPYSLSSLFTCWRVSLMLLAVISGANTAYSLFSVKSPLKNGKPLTSDSKDPNGSLLNGLKNKKLSTKVCLGPSLF